MTLISYFNFYSPSNLYFLNQNENSNITTNSYVSSTNDLFDKKMASEATRTFFDYNSYFVYFYFFLYFIYSIPFFFITLIKSIFNFSQLINIFSYYYNVLIS